MFFDIKNWKNKSNSKEFLINRKQVLKLIQSRNNKSPLKEFSFLNQDNKVLKHNILEASKDYYRFKKIVVIGTGGSSLGSKAILEVNSNKNVIFIENIDPNYVLKKVNCIKEKNTLLIIISKSGETTEVIALYQVIINYFSNYSNIKKNIIIITEEKNSTLYKLSKKENIKFIEHNNKIGGRFSCFSETGLVPVKLAGLNSIYIKDLSDKTFREYFDKSKTSLAENISSIFNLIRKTKYRGHTVISYQESLQSLIMWYRQLWGESLGKNGKGVHIIPAIGSIDQHSQLQMWLDGPDDLFYTIILSKKRKIDFKLRDNKKFIPNHLRDRKLGDILNTMAIATFKELVKAGRPVRLIYLDEDTLYPAIKLMAFLMLEVSLLGKYLGINPFNQPAVERVKILTKKLLIKNA
ncbi:hypothetical protein OA264_00100 [Alphaproteobacteria bacterium]|nr:hypothetical protein [Alphaproteobacteria bacterium]